MSLDSWLKGTGSKPGSKRKTDDAVETSPFKRKFTKEMSQDSFSWYIQDSEGIWHCSVCREAKHDNPYSRRHTEKAKTTNHRRHAACKYFKMG